jgi:hypothetical protein
MYVLAINHQVEDYDRWKAVFDALSPKEGGASFHRINRDVDDPNVITVVAGWADVDGTTGPGRHQPPQPAGTDRHGNHSTQDQQDPAVDPLLVPAVRCRPRRASSPPLAPMADRAVLTLMG